MALISEDLPDYLKTPQSISCSRSVKLSKKLLKTPLTQGISIESPDFFRIPQVPVISTSHRKEYLSQEKCILERDLKKYQVTSSRGLNYCDFRQSKFDYDSVSLANRVGLFADHKPRLKLKGGFASCYQKSLSKGFGINRGEFTVEHVNPKILRIHTDKANNLKGIIEKTSHKRIVKTEFQVSPLRNQKKEISGFLRTRTPIKNQTRYLDDIEDFESRIQNSNISVEERRRIYCIK
ncbi:hypothetical protein SteCoe_18756 [Stentor coeruleus]|uniref:Uncharacterized protein n=1 Tax=Stentor coeruleus TaxID=5963 RepID=A0A1R2BVT0_9CILI|nr:hypothetical protein SteCoe_18756 [Stentor coeruleus]